MIGDPVSPRMPGRRLSRLTGWLLPPTLSLLGQAAIACPNCKDALADEASAEGTAARAFSISVMAMLGILGLVAFALIRVMVIACREADALSAARTGDEPAPASGDVQEEHAAGAVPPSGMGSLRPGRPVSAP